MASYITYILYNFCACKLLFAPIGAIFYLQSSLCPGILPFTVRVPRTRKTIFPYYVPHFFIYIPRSVPIWFIYLSLRLPIYFIRLENVDIKIRKNIKKQLLISLRLISWILAKIINENILFILHKFYCQ